MDYPQYQPLQKKTPSLVSFTLMFGISFISIALASLFLFLGRGIPGYVIIILFGLVISSLAYYVKKEINGTERLGVFFGILSPIPGFLIILTVMTAVNLFFQKFVSLEGESMGGMMTIIAPGMHPEITAILFYLSCNVLLLISIIRKKQFIELLWYVFAIAVIGISWLISYLFTSSVVQRY